MHQYINGDTSCFVKTPEG